MIPGAFSVHEPDVIAPGYPNKDRIRALGLYETVIGKALGRTGARNLSELFIAGRLSPDEAASRIRRSRSRYYGATERDPVIESHPGWYGLLPVLPKAFQRYRALLIVRDPRTWATSVMRWGRPYGQRDWVARLGLRRLNPKLTGERELARSWRSLSRFEKVCWTWSAINERLLRHARDDPNTLLARYEDVFLNKGRYGVLNDLLAFVCAFDDRSFDYHIAPNILGRRIHESGRGFPDWTEWEPELAVTLTEYCGPLMADLGYGLEPEWRAMTASASSSRPSDIH